MTCKETQVFMDGYLDGELDLVRGIELEHHLRDCSSCSALHKSRMELRIAVGAGPMRYSAPTALQRSVRAALVKSDREEHRPERRWFQAQWPALAASAAALSLIALSLTAIVWLRPAPNSIQSEVIDSHIRSLMPNHLMDVVSTDQHTVKPWFAGKVDFSPPVRDFPNQGFPLAGGRLDYIGDHAAAAIVYRRNQHVINVFVWPVNSGDSRSRTRVVQGYNLIETVRSGMQYWIVSDLNRQELDQFARLLLAP